MIHILYTKFDSELPLDLWEHYLSLVPLGQQTQLLSYKNQRDQYACLFGKLLLMEAYKEYGEENILSLIAISKYGKPYIQSDLNFNLSHSGRYVICAIGEGIELGVDIEKMKSIAIEEFKSIFTCNEWNTIINSGLPLNEFYNYWTQKESVLKADGRGLSIPIKDIFIHEGYADLYNKKWYLQKINLDPNYIIHLASDFPELLAKREVYFS